MQSETELSSRREAPPHPPATIPSAAGRPGLLARIRAAFPPMEPIPRGVLLAALAILCVQALVILGVGRDMGTATDEGSYFNAANIVVRHGWSHESTVLHGPVPFYANQLLVPDFPSGGYDPRTTPHGVIERGRMGTLPFALLSSILVFLWARTLFGEVGGLFALLLAGLNPMMLGFGALVLVDAQHAAMVFLVLFLLWCWLETRSVILLPCLGIAIGLALSTKYMAAFVALVAGAILIVAGLLPFRGARPGARGLLRSLGSVALVALVAFATMHALYRFKEPLFSFEADEHASNVVRTVTEMPVIGTLVRALPAPFLRGIDYQLRQGERPWTPFLDGVVAPSHDDYYVRSMLYKTPEILLLCAALVALLRLPRLLRPDAPRGWHTAAVATFSYVALAFGYLSLGTRMQLGIRYILPVYPVLLLWQGSLLCDVRRFSGWVLALFALTAGLHLADLRANWPDLISYYNVASGGQARAFEHFIGTNSDFGQYALDGPRLLHEHDPAVEVIGPRSGPRFGKLAITAGSLRSEIVRWLKNHPVIDHLGASWWVFEVTPEGYERKLATSGDPDLRRDLCLAYLGAGRDEDARPHLAALDPERAAPLEDLLRVRAAAEQDPTKQNLEALVVAWSGLGRFDLAEAVVLAHQDVLRDSRAGAEARVRSTRERQDYEGLIEVFEEFQFEPGDPLRLEFVTALLREGRHAEGFAAFDDFRAHLGPKVAASLAVEKRARELDLYGRFKELLR